MKTETKIQLFGDDALRFLLGCIQSGKVDNVTYDLNDDTILVVFNENDEKVSIDIDTDGTVRFE